MTLAATIVWEIRTDGAATNGGGYKSNAGTTDYSQQAAAQLAVTDLACVTGGAVCTNTVGDFTTAMVGSVCYISGTHFVTGWYEIITYTNAHQITLDRDPTDGTNGSAGTCNVGGALNGIGTLGLVLSTAAQSVAGMKAYVRGGTYSLTNTVVNTDGGPLDLDASLQDAKSFRIKGYATDAANRDAFTGTRPVIDCAGQAPTSVIELKGTYANPHTAIFLEIDGDSRNTIGIVGNNWNWDKISHCYIHDCDGTSGVSTVSARDSKVSGCNGDGFYRCTCSFCWADANGADGFDCSANNLSHCITSNNNIGVSNTYSTITNCSEFNSTSDGFKSLAHSIFENCVSYSAGGYAFNTSTSDMMVNCASDGGASGHKNPTTPLMIEIGSVTLTGDPYTNSATGDFSLDNTTNEGNLCREVGLDPYGQTGDADIGAVQTAYPAAADVLYNVDAGSAKGTYYGPNLDANPGVVDAAAVITTAHFGVANATQGTAAGGGGYTYGDNNPSFVLTTADGHGDYVPISDSDTVDGGVSYGDGEAGTGVNATTILTALGLASGNLDTQLAAILAAATALGGSGADDVTITVAAGGVPVADADVWITSDAAGTTVVAGTVQTDSSGQYTFKLDAGSTYYLWMQKDGVNSIKGERFVAVAD